MARFLEQVVNQVLHVQAQEALRAAPYERTPEGQGHRNGAHDRALTTRVRTLTLRDGSVISALLARYQRHEQAFVLALLEMVIKGEPRGT